MAREERVRLHEDEKELLEEARSVLYPGAEENVPLGKVVGDVSDDFLSRNGGGGDDDE